MLGVASYDPQMIAAAHDRLQRQLATYDAVAKSAAPDTLAAFAPEFFGTLILALDHTFMHRLRGKEGKDGNPLNEVRMLAVSLLEHDGVMTKDNTIKYDPARSVTDIAIGEKIVIDRPTAERLALAFLEQIAAKFA